MSCGKVVSFLRRFFLKVPYISLVNLVENKEVVPELVADGMRENTVRYHLQRILPGSAGREAMLTGYADMRQKLGQVGAPAKAAQLMTALLKRKRR